jgi:hypothetical protein
LIGLQPPEQFVFAFAKLGETERARTLLTKVEPGYVNNGHIALGHLALNNPSKSFEFLQRGVEENDPSVLDGLRINIALDELRGDPRFDDE